MTEPVHSRSSREEPTMQHNQVRPDGDGRARRTPRLRPEHLDCEEPQHGAWRAATSCPGTGRRLLRLVGVTAALTSATPVGSAAPSGALADKWHIEQGRAIEDPPPDNLLFSASCPSAKVCVAVGYNGHGNFQGTLVETMNKNSWTVTPSPVTASPYIGDSLNAVSCGSPTSCAAAGRATDVTGTRERTLVLRLKGGTWRLSPSPNTTAALNSLAGISCASVYHVRSGGRRRHPKLSEDTGGVPQQRHLAGRAQPGGRPSVRRQFPQRRFLHFPHALCGGRLRRRPDGYGVTHAYRDPQRRNLENNAQPRHVVANE